MFHKTLSRFNSRENLIIIYKLLNDSLLIWLVFFVFALIAEGLIPDIISSHIGLYAITIIVLINILLIHRVGIAAQIKNTDIPKINKKIAWPLFFILALLLFNSLLALNIYLNLFILTATLIIGYFIFKTLQEEE